MNVENNNNTFDPTNPKSPLDEFLIKLANSPRDTLDDHSARDLLSALHWTSKTDLKPSLYRPNEIDKSWENLMQADEALHRFYDFELVKIIKAYKSKSSEGDN